MSSSIKHVSIIMDGNGRWAQERGRPRVWGHVRGSQIVSEIVEEASNMGLNAITLYAFSTENWKRPNSEIRVLFSLLRKYIIKERKKILQNNIRFKIIGSIAKLPDTTKKLVKDLEQETADNSGLKLNFAFDYGGRSEIIHAVNEAIINAPQREISESDIERFLFTKDVGDVDLMIRTSGEQRISNFLLWQSAYAEFYFTDIKWPDFTPQLFRDIVSKVSHRERRFGMTGNQLMEKDLENDKPLYDHQLNRTSKQ